MALQIFTQRFTPAAEIPAGAAAVSWRDTQETGQDGHEHTFHRSLAAAKAQYRRDSANHDFRANGWMLVAREAPERSGVFSCPSRARRFGAHAASARQQN